MKIQCDVCEKAEASVICCADEAALCAKCDVEVHAANKLASKHQRLHLQSLSSKLPPCDICQEKAAFIFCVEDRALFCKDCDEPIHAANTLAANHQRFLATGIRVALSSSNCNKENLKNSIEPKPPRSNSQQNVTKIPAHQVPGITSPPSWAVDDLLQFSDYDSSNRKEHLEFDDLDWLTEMNLFGEQIRHEAHAAAEVPQLRMSQPSYTTSHRSGKCHMPNKRPRIEIPDDDEEFFTVPDLG
ncbi:B-box zinc finger protein 25-like [Primulina eburnea]|uniref:B-box zinc finger protein 25-like n=1 Tax=Primulina eburnea TaxID=1245227 RepID=UPI003C6C2C54